MDKQYNFKASSSIESFLPFKSRDIFIIASILQVVIKGEGKEALKLALEWLRQQSPDLLEFRGFLEQVKVRRELTQMDMFGVSAPAQKIHPEYDIDNPLFQAGYLQGLKDASFASHCQETIQPPQLRFP